MVTRRRLLALSSLSIAGLAGCNFRRSEEDGTPTPQPEPKPEEDPSILNIRDFGAEVDGSTDDTMAIQRALSAAESGDTVFFPAGTTLVSTGHHEDEYHIAILLSGDELADDVTIKGVGRNSVVRMAGGHERNHQVFFFDVQSGYRGLVVRDLRVDGNKDQQTAALGNGGHGFLSDNANNPDVPIDVLIENVWVEDCNQSGISPKHGGFVINRCTVQGCPKHGISPDSWSDGKYDPPIEIRNCYSTLNGKDTEVPTYGIDVSGGKVLVENCVCENNGQGTKTTPAVIEAIYRRVRLVDNDINGYLRPSTPSETDGRAQVTFEDVISEGNYKFGFQLGMDTDYTVPSGAKIIARGNSYVGDNIYISRNAALDADTVISTDAIDGHGLNSTTTAESYINNYYYAGNHSGPTRSLENIQILNEENIADELRRLYNQSENLLGEERVRARDLELSNVPNANEVGASDSFVQ